MTTKASILAVVGTWLACALPVQAGQRLYDFDAVTRQSLARIEAKPPPRGAPAPPVYAGQPPPVYTLPQRAAAAQAQLRDPPPARGGLAQAETGQRTFLERTVAEFVVGGWLHDPGQDNNESNTWDFNAEIIFRPIEFFEFENPILRFLATPRPIIGGSVNNEGKTHTAYIALNLNYPFESGIFAGFSFGIAYHTGELHQATEECAPGEGCTLPGNRRYVNTREPSLGTRILFRESLELGYRFVGGHGVSAYVAHISQGGFFDSDNDGMNFVGLRYSYALR